MSRALSKPMQKAIRDLYAGGMAKSAIAAKLQIRRETVAKYSMAVDAEIDLAGTPAAKFTEDEVALLRGLTSLLQPTTCDSCGVHFSLLVHFTPATNESATFCPECGDRMVTKWNRSRSG